MFPVQLLPYVGAPATDNSLQAFRLGSFSLPESARCLYAVSDGFSIPELGTRVLSLSEAHDYGQAVAGLSGLSIYGLLPITDSNDSNPYCLILGAPLNGAIMHLNHDGDVRVTHSSMQAFLASLATLLDQKADLIDDLQPENILDPRLVADADAMIANALEHDDADGLDTASPVVWACSPAMLIRLLSCEDMWIREAAAERCGLLELHEARSALQQLATGGDRQDHRAAQAALKRLRAARM